MTQLEKWQIEDIEDTLRMVAIHLNSKERETCLDRNVMKCWNWVVDALNNVPVHKMSENGVMYRLRKGQILERRLR